MAIDFNKILGDLETNARNSSSDMEEMLKEIGAQLMAAQGKAGQAEQQFKEALGAPAPRVNPIAETLVRTLGLSSEALTGQQGAFKEAQQLVGGEQARLDQRRQESLQELETAYRDAAQRAAKIGDMDTSLKFKVKADKALADMDKLTKMQTTKLEADLANERLGRQITSAERIAGAEIASRERIARITASSRPEHLPPELSASLAPVLEQLKQLDQARGAIASDAKLKEGDRRKRTAEIDTKYQQLEQQYQDTLKAYFNEPAGSSGEAAQTPLGVIMERAKQAGAVTFEDFKKIAYSNSASAVLRGYDLNKSIAAARVIFPTKAEVNRAVHQYKELTTGPLRGSKIAQNRQKIDDLAAKLTSWGYQVANSEALLAPQDFTLPETVVSATRK